jgi:hypothetical protein
MSKKNLNFNAIVRMNNWKLDLNLPETPSDTSPTMVGIVQIRVQIRSKKVKSSCCCEVGGCEEKREQEMGSIDKQVNMW